MTSEELQSKTIDWLRFPLIVGVIFIHDGIGANSDYVLCNHIHDLFSDVFGRISVPLFFFISGFLFFYKTDWNKSIYILKLTKRMKNILLPYLFCNTFVLVLNAFIFKNSFVPRDSDWMVYLFKYLGFPSPVCFQLWFIRDLMIIIAFFTPIIYYLITHLRFYVPIVLIISWIVSDRFSSTGLSFFCIGSYIAINHRNIVEDFRNLYIVSMSYPLIAVVDTLTKGQSFNCYIHKFGIIVGILFVINIISSLLDKGKIHLIPFLAKASFFVYLFHEPIIEGQLIKNGLALIQRTSFYNNEISLILMYFLVSLLTILITLMIYCILLKICDLCHLKEASLWRYMLGIKR